MRFKRRLDDWSAGNDCEDKDWFIGAEIPNALLNYIQESAWNRLIDFAKGYSFANNGERVSGFGVEKISEFIGEHRHLLFVTSEDCAYVKFILQQLKLTSDDYIAVAKGGDYGVSQILSAHGFLVGNDLDIEGAVRNIRLDPYPDSYRGGVYLTVYGGIILGRRKDGIIRNSHELAVAFLALTVLLGYDGCEF
jgi:hypothetical protein